MRRLVCLGLLIGAAAGAHAQDIEGGYVGLSYGSFDFTSDDAFGLRLADNAGTSRVLGGFQFNDYYAIEATWAVADDIEETLRAQDPTLGNVSLRIAAEYEIATLRFVAMAPMDSFSIFGGGGFYDADATSSAHYEDDFGVLDLAEDRSESGAMVVGGIQYELRRIAIRGEYEWFDTDDVDASLLTVSAIFRF